jgi:hypothetical protein
MADQPYAVLLEVPHSGRSAWRWAAAEFDERLTDQVIPPVLSADLVAEVRRGRDGLRLRIAVTVRAADVAEAVRAAWDVLEAASDVGGFDLASATARAGPAPLALSSYRASAGRSPATTLAVAQDCDAQAEARARGVVAGHNRRPRRFPRIRQGLSAFPQVSQGTACRLAQPTCSIWTR